MLARLPVRLTVVNVVLGGAAAVAVAVVLLVS